MLNDSIDSPVTDITVYGGFFGDHTPVDQYNAYVQDDWTVNDRLILNLGLRYDLWTGFDLNQTSNPIWQELSTQTTYNEYYLRDFQGGKGGQLKNDKNNWGPRLGFTYDLNGSGKHIVRGGWGIYYDFPYTNATILFPAAAVQSNYGVAYNVHDSNGIRNPDGTFFRPGQPLPPNTLPGLGSFPPNEVASPTLATPKSTQASLGYSWEATSWLGLTFDAVSIRYRDLPFRFRANPTLDANGNPMADRRFSDFGNFRLWYGKGKADYDGFNLGAHARVSEKVQLQGFYTYSKAKGNLIAGADEFRITDGGHQPDFHRLGRDASINSLDPLCSACVGPLNTDARHRATLSVIYSAPFGINLSGIGRYRSALPYTVVNADGVDLNGDSFRNDLAPGISHVNSARGDSFSQVDVRISKEIKLQGVGFELIGEIFNLFNSTNPAAFDRFGVAHAYAGDPGQGEQRLAQLGLRIHY
ncbi:MAG: TonB-dependent receptor [Thermoanaerobaculia bacterium]